MTTIPPEPAPTSPREPREAYQARDVAESFGTDAGRYDRARPDYPDTLVARILAASPGRDVLDVGCGTGIAARQFQAAGCRVFGVDPDARMADLARRRGLDVEVATFEAWDPAGWEFDVVIAAQAWHWVEPVAGTAKAVQALRPGGRLAVFWNVFQPSAALSEAFGDVYRRVETGLPFSPWSRPLLDFYLAGCEKVADEMRRTGAFCDPELWRFDWNRYYTRDEWLDVVPTAGGHSQIPPAKLAELLAGLGAAVDMLGGGFTMDFATVGVTAASRGRR